MLGAGENPCIPALREQGTPQGLEKLFRKRRVSAGVVCLLQEHRMFTLLPRLAANEGSGHARNRSGFAP